MATLKAWVNKGIVAVTVARCFSSPLPKRVEGCQIEHQQKTDKNQYISWDFLGVRLFHIVGVGSGVPAGVGAGVGVSEGVGAGVGLIDGSGVPDGVGLGVVLTLGEGDTEGSGVPDGVGVGVATTTLIEKNVLGF